MADVFDTTGPWQVTAFGKRATTAFQRAEAKEAAKKKGAAGGAAHKSHHFVWH